MCLERTVELLQKGRVLQDGNLQVENMGSIHYLNTFDHLKYCSKRLFESEERISYSYMEN